MRSVGTAETLAIDERLILPGLAAASAAEAIRTLSERMLRAGYVTEGFADAVLAREDSFPTGLPTPIPVALPHTDAHHCRRPAIAVGLLAEPVFFGVMGIPDQTIPVQVVFLLAVTEPKQQVRWLKQLVEFFQQPDLIGQLQAAPSPSAVARILRGHLRLEESAGAPNDQPVAAND
jgi:PTS system galactitol-specific IIA component